MKKSFLYILVFISFGLLAQEPNKTSTKGKKKNVKKGTVVVRKYKPKTNPQNVRAIEVEESAE